MKKFTQHFAENKKNIIAGLELMSNTYLPRIYRATEYYSRGYDISYGVTDSYKIKETYYSDEDTIKHFEEYNDPWYSFPELINRLKTGNVIFFRADEETAILYSLDKTKLAETLHANRLEHRDSFDGEDLDELKQYDIEKLSRLP